MAGDRKVPSAPKVRTGQYRTQFEERLKVDLCSELEHPGVKCRRYLTKVAGAQSIAYLVELGVVPYVETLSSELEASLSILAEWEALEYGEIPVVTARATQGVEARISPRPNCRKHERLCVKPLADRVRIGDVRHLVRPVSR